MPTLIAWRGRAARFTDFYSAANTCSPARVALMTWCYPPRSGVNAVLFHDSPDGMPSEAKQPTIAELLRDCEAIAPP